MFQGRIDELQSNNQMATIVIPSELTITCPRNVLIKNNIKDKFTVIFEGKPKKDEILIKMDDKLNFSFFGFNDEINI